MSGEENGFGVHLYKLYVAGRDNLPSVAAVYVAANGYVANTDSGLSAAFLRPDYFGGGGYGPVYGPWVALRNELQTILADTAKNLELTGEALCLAADEYAKADHAAQKVLNDRKKGTHFPSVKIPAPRYP